MVRPAILYIHESDALQTWNWVIGSPGQWVIWVIFHVRVTGSSFWPGVRTEFFRFSKKCPKCTGYIWYAEMTKVIVRCLLLDWNQWMSVHAVNFYFYLWLLKILWPEDTSSWHFEFTIEQDHRINWVSGSLDSRVTGSLGQVMWPSSVTEASYMRLVGPSACWRRHSLTGLQSNSSLLVVTLKMHDLKMTDKLLANCEHNYVCIFDVYLANYRKTLLELD